MSSVSTAETSAKVRWQPPKHLSGAPEGAHARRLYLSMIVNSNCPDKEIQADPWSDIDFTGPLDGRPHDRFATPVAVAVDTEYQGSRTLTVQAAARVST